MAEHGIPQCLDEAVRKLVAVKPTNPKEFLQQELGMKPLRPIPSVVIPEAQTGPRTRNTSIICTIGPKVASVEMLGKLMDSGMNVTRMNFSHGSYEWFSEVVANKNKACAERPGLHVALALDTKGPEIRTGTMIGGEITVVPGSEVTITTEDELKDKGSSTLIYVDYKDLPTTVSPGMFVYMDDGLLCLEVTECMEKAVKTKAINGATLSDRRGVNLPNAKVTLPAVSPKDKADIEFGISQGIDVIFASFIRTAAQVTEIKDLLKSHNAGHIQVFSKIENQEGLDNFDEILEVTDGVMVARGDLGIEIPAHKVFSAQKSLIRRCNLAAKPVICATQMLESMIVNPRPTRAEVSDVGNAIADGADCVMLSGETAKGKWPLNAVEIMGDVCLEAEYQIQNEAMSLYFKQATPRPVTATEAMARSAVSLSFEEGFGMIVVISESGETEKFVAKYRPRVPVLVISDKGHIARQSMFLRGLQPLMVPSLADTCVNSLLTMACNHGKEKGLAKTGQSVICIYDSDLSDGVEEATTLRVVTVE